MRSRPFTPPPPLPPLLSELSAYLPNSDRRDGTTDSNSEVALSDLDPETSRLLPRKRTRHRVRIQGRLAPVRSVSVANLRSAALRDAGNTGLDKAVGATVPRRRSEDDVGSDVDEAGEDEFEERDTQLRGSAYGRHRDFFEVVAVLVFAVLEFRLWFRVATLSLGARSGQEMDPIGAVESYRGT
ncbi:hypothetical protein F4804DRAFT_335559 [Jackrogersella minutella]|nr:hypothetical protein F4804DRAFT_335559 [Jackrogersella minutella]